MTWLGRLLEFSFATESVLADHQGLQQQGFQALSTQDVWPYPYAVASDGHCHIGLHETLPSPFTLTFVHPDLLAVATESRAYGLEPEAQELGSERFNFIHLVDPTGLGIHVISARSFSPAYEPKESRLGTWQGLHLPAHQAEAQMAFWEHLGCRPDAQTQSMFIDQCQCVWSDDVATPLPGQLSFSKGRWPSKKDLSL